MPTRVFVGDHVVNFPDGMSEQDITKAMDELHAPKAAAPEGKSLGGFLGNVVNSGGRFIRDTASGLVDAGKFIADASPFSPNIERAQGRAEQVKDVVRNAPRIASAAGTALKNRYGGLEQIGNTLYNDPVGVAADVSMLLDPAAGLAKAGGLAKTASVLSKAAELTNPMRAIGSVVEPMAHGAANLAVRSTLRPPAAVRADFGGSRAIADAVLQDRVASEAGAQRKLTGSVAQADQMLADAQAAGTPGVSRVAVARSVLGEPQATAKLRTRLGVPDQSQDLSDTAKAIFKNNPSDIPLTDAQSMKREAQSLAYEAGADNQSVKKAAEIAKAKALRTGIEARVPEVGPVNERSQRLLGSQQAFAAAEDRPRALTNMLSVLGGGAGFAGGGPVGAAIMPMLIKAMDSPRVGAMTGIGIDALGKASKAPMTVKAALLARLLGQEAPDQP